MKINFPHFSDIDIWHVAWYLGYVYMVIFGCLCFEVPGTVTSLLGGCYMKEKNCITI